MPGRYVLRRARCADTERISRAGHGGGAQRDYVPVPPAVHNGERDARPGNCRLGAAAGGRQPSRSPAGCGSAAGSAGPESRGQTAEHAEQALRLRWAGLNGLRTACTEENGPERLREAARSGAPPCPVVAVAFEGRFVVAGPWSWWQIGEFPPLFGTPAPFTRAGVRQLGGPVDAERQAPRSPLGYWPIGAKWARRLEAFCRIHSRQTGDRASGLLWLLDDMLSWTPDDGARMGARHQQVDRDRGRTVHTVDLGFPASPAWFISRLGLEAKALRRANDGRRRARSIGWGADQRLGLIHPPGPMSERRELLCDELGDELGAVRNERLADGACADLERAAIEPEDRGDDERG